MLQGSVQWLLLCSTTGSTRQEVRDEEITDRSSEIKMDAATKSSLQLFPRSSFYCDDILEHFKFQEDVVKKEILF